MEQPSAGGPEPLGPPPQDLHRWPLPLRPHSDAAFRVYRLDEESRHYGKERRWRFDDPLGEYGVMYTALTPEGAFAETLLPQPGALTLTAYADAGTVPVSSAMIDTRSLAEVTFTSPVRCVDLSGEHLAAIGADASIFTGPYVGAQQWSRALFTHPSQPDALLYRSRRDPSQLSLAIHERADPKVKVTPLGGLAEPQHAGVRATVIRRYHVVIVPSRPS